MQGLGEGKVAASSFRTSYVPLNKQADFINGMQVNFSRAVGHATACLQCIISILRSVQLQ